MNAEEFREFGRATIDFIADYLENIRDRYVKLRSEVFSIINKICLK